MLNNITLQKALDNIIPLSLRPFYASDVTHVYGFWGSTLSNCTFSGMYYNSDSDSIELTDDVVITTMPVWINATVAELPTLATQEYGMLIKNGIVLTQDEWSWLTDHSIQVITPILPTDIFLFTYEQLKYTITDQIQVGVLDSVYDIIIDGFVYRNVFDYTKNTQSITQKIIFDKNYQCALNYTSYNLSKGLLKDEKDNIIVNWSYINSNTIRIDSNVYKPGVYLFTYDVKKDFVDMSGIEVYYRSKSDVDWSDWIQTEFNTIIEPKLIYQIKVIIRKPITQDSIRIKSLVIKAEKDY